jgi:uncharacterized protein YdaU (DUF1376 family)
MAGKRMYMPLWPDAWLLDTGHLTYEQKGIYNDLLQHMWLRDGYLQNDDAFLARLLGLTLGKWRRVSPAIMALLTVEQNRVTQKRLIAEYNRSIEKIEKLTKSGREGGLAKSLKNKGSGLADATANATADATADAQAMPGQTPEQTAGKRSAHYSLLSTPPKKPSVSVGEGAGEDPDAIFREAAATTSLDRKGQPYAFEQGVIKLSRNDYDRFKGIYTLLNLDAELISMARWVETESLKKGGDWFNPMVGALGKKQRDAEKQARESKATAEALARKAARHVPGQAAI